MVMLGARQLLTMLREQSCPAILNSNQELIGPWHDEALYLGSQWTPQAKKSGILYLAHVMAPGIYGKSSFEKFYQFAQHHFRIETFTTDEAAAAWLLN